MATAITSPTSVDVIDQSENGLAELVRDFEIANGAGFLGEAQKGRFGGR